MRPFVPAEPVDGGKNETAPKRRWVDVPGNTPIACAVSLRHSLQG